MRNVVMLVLAVVACGCNDEVDPVTDAVRRISELEAARAADQATIAALVKRLEATEGLASSAAAAAGAASDSLKGYATGEALSSEAARAKAAEDGIAAKVGTILEPHLIAPGGEDLGRYLGGSTAWNEKAGLAIDYLPPVQFAQVLYDQPNCKGRVILNTPWQTTSSHGVVDDMGRVWKLGASVSSAETQSRSGQGVCSNDRNVVNGSYATDTGIVIKDIRFSSTRIDWLPAAR